MTGDDRSVLRDPELVELLADEPELLAILDAYATTQVEPRHANAPSAESRRAFASRMRRGPVLAAGFGAAVLAVGLALLPIQLGNRELSVVDHALAAVSTGPVLHAVLEVPVSDVTHAPGPVSFTTVELGSGQERQVTATIELWYNPSRHLLRLLQRREGAVAWELLESPAGVQDGRGGRDSAPASPTVDPALAVFFKGYKQALADGTAAVVGSETIDGRRAQWLRFPPHNGSGLPREIAVDSVTHEPLLLRAVCGECSNAPPTYRVLALEGVSERRADFTPPTTRSREVGAYAASRSVISAAETRTLLGGDAFWSGSAVGGKRLASIQLLQVSSHSDTPPSDANMIDRGVALQFVYGDRPSLDATTAPSDSVTISESIDYEFVFSGFNFNNREAGQPLTLAGAAVPPEGEIALSSTQRGHWTAQLRENGLYVEIGGPSRALVLEAARALERVDA